MFRVVAIALVAMAAYDYVWWDGFHIQAIHIVLLNVLHGLFR